MKIGDAIFPDLDLLADALGEARIRRRIEEHATGSADQTVGPVRDHQRADNAHERVHENPPVEPAGKKPDDREYRSRCIGKDMDVRGSDVVVAMRVIVLVILIDEVMVFLVDVPRPHDYEQIPELVERSKLRVSNFYDVSPLAVSRCSLAGARFRP